MISEFFCPLFMVFALLHDQTDVAVIFFLELISSVTCFFQFIMDREAHIKFHWFSQELFIEHIEGVKLCDGS